MTVLEARVRFLETGGADNNTEATAYERDPDPTAGRLQFGWTTCAHGMTQWPGADKACGTCSSPWNDGYECDSCGHTGGTGHRYACTVCNDYDICQACNDANVHSHHTLTQVKHMHQKYGGVHPDSAKRPRGDSKPTLSLRRDGPIQLGMGPQQQQPRHLFQGDPRTQQNTTLVPENSGYASTTLNAGLGQVRGFGPPIHSSSLQ